MAKLTETLYIRSTSKNGVDSYEVVKDVKDFKMSLGDKDKAGVYTLKTILEVRAVAQTTEIANT